MDIAQIYSKLWNIENIRHRCCSLIRRSAATSQLLCFMLSSGYWLFARNRLMWIRNSVVARQIPALLSLRMPNTFNPWSLQQLGVTVWGSLNGMVKLRSIWYFVQPLFMISGMPMLCFRCDWVSIVNAKKSVFSLMTADRSGGKDEPLLQCLCWTSRQHC